MFVKLKMDLMSAQSDANAEIVRADNLDQSGILSVVESKTVEFGGHLETESAELLQSLHNIVGNLLELVVEQAVVLLFQELGGRVNERLQVLLLLLVQAVRIGKDFFEFELSAEEIHRERTRLDWLLVMLLGGRCL